MKKLLILFCMMGVVHINYAESLDKPVITPSISPIVPIDSQCVIELVRNESDCPIVFSRINSPDLIIEADRDFTGSFKNLRLTPEVAVPYVSISKYLKQYTMSTPFTPHQALAVKTEKGIFRIWCNEEGVVCAPDPDSDFMSWRTRLLVNKAHFSQPGSLLRLLLLIDCHGAIRLKHIVSRSKN